MQREMIFRFLDEDVAAPARLLREQAPETCSAVWNALPASGLARHGIYSGSEVYLVLPALLTVPREHATTIVGAGDVGFLTVEKGSGYGIEEGYSEVCWFYDLDLDARGADCCERLRPAPRRRRLPRRLPAHAAGRRKEARDRPRVACAPASSRSERPTATYSPTRSSRESGNPGGCPVQPPSAFGVRNSAG